MAIDRERMKDVLQVETRYVHQPALLGSDIVEAGHAARRTCAATTAATV